MNQTSMNYIPFKSLSPLQIEINLKPLKHYESNASKFFLKDCYIEYKDNGTGIHPKVLMECLTSLGSNHLLTFKGDFNCSEHGLNMKLACLRLA